MGTGKRYDEEFKKQAVKLAKEVGNRAYLVQHWERGSVKLKMEK